MNDTNQNNQSQTENDSQLDEIESLLEAQIPESLDGSRLDQALARLFDQFSRSRLQQWIRDGQVTVDGKKLRAKDKVTRDQLVCLHAQETSEVNWAPEAIELDVVYEDEHIIVINKPAGMVVHPAAGNPGGTLLNALLHYAPETEAVPRAGIIHRLDKDTSGVLVVARSLLAHKSLVEQLQERSFEREYLAVVNGVLTAGGTVDAPIGRHPQHRIKMAVVDSGKEAVTHYRVEQRFRGHCAIKVNLETGRTHQIRVHMAYIHHPLIGDPLYGGRFKLPAGCSEELRHILSNFKRQALHARYLGLIHPKTGETMGWGVETPADLQNLLDILTEDAKSG